MSLSLIFLHLLLFALHTSQDMIESFCRAYLWPSVHRDGDFVLGVFFPLYYMEMESDMIRLSFLLKPEDKVTASW